MSEAMERSLMEFETKQGEEQENIGKGNRSQFNVKMNGNFVGRGWLQEGKYGKYVSLSVNQDVPAGSKVYISPNKYNEGLLG